MFLIKKGTAHAEMIDHEYVKSVKNRTEAPKFCNRWSILMSLLVLNSSKYVATGNNFKIITKVNPTYKLIAPCKKQKPRHHNHSQHIYQITQHRQN